MRGTLPSGHPPVGRHSHARAPSKGSVAIRQKNHVLFSTLSVCGVNNKMVSQILLDSSDSVCNEDPNNWATGGRNAQLSLR